MLKFLNTLLFITFLTSAVTAEIIDPDGPKNSVLGRVSSFLDDQGIDVRYGSNAGTQNPSKAQLTPLNTFQTSAQLDYEGSTFANLFKKGISIESALFAVDTRNGVPFSNPEEFKSRWRDVKQSKRVFISFNKADLEIAHKVASALNSSGYSTFIFTGKDASGSFNAIDTGNYFRQSGHKFVVDTANSRASSAVAAEAMFARNPAIFQNLGELFDNGTSKSQQSCCKLCTYQNGRLVSCGQMICGSQCEGAR